jgi:RNA polymerase sigma factor (sigma-70 family)
MRRNHPSLSASHRDYVVGFHRRLRTLLSRRGGVVDIDDVVQAECLALLGKLAETVAAYPRPETYAAVRARGGRAAIDYGRAESAQRGAGAVHQFDDDGRRIRGRQIVNGDGVHHDACHDHYDDRPGKRGAKGTYFDVHAYRIPDHGTEYADQAVVSEQLRQALLRATPEQRTVLVLVDGYGYTVTEAAAYLGVARETVSRLRSKAYRAVRGGELQPPC